MSEMDDLKTKGFAVLRPLMSDQIGELKSFLLTRLVYVDAHVPQTERNKGTDRRFLRTDESAIRSECVCVHTDDAIVAPYLLELGLENLGLASAYLGRDPAVSYSANAFWTRPGPAGTRPDIQEFHRDQDDVRFLALFVYLNDVRYNAEGPHELKGPDGVVRPVYGPAGTVFVADTMHEHRGLKPRQGERGIAWWRWGVSDRPPAGVWDKIEPVSSLGLGSRYPADLRLRESIRLLVTPSDEGML